MKYRKLGNSGLNVSVISLGTWKYKNGETDSQTWSRLFSQAFEQGVNYFDTAITYDTGNAERFLGRLWSIISRDKVILGTKCFFPTGEGPDNKGLSAKHIEKCVHDSLKNLNTDNIDLFQCHRWDNDTPIEETIQAMDMLVKQGKIRYWGLGSATAAQVTEATLKSDLMGCVRPVSHQHVYNMFNRTAEFGALEAGKRFGLGFLAYSPLAQGVLTGKYAAGKIPSGSRATSQDANTIWDFKPEKIEKSRLLAELAQKAGIDTATFALAWCLRTDTVSSVITSVNNESQLSINLAAADTEVSNWLDEAARIMDNEPYNIYTT
ncbi:MAG: aldo/keto reductase [Bacteroidetes bacterium]|nr:aldo/keto reductase [Bacteroidota bacterium]